MNSVDVSLMPGAGGEAYAQWVRRAVARASTAHNDAGVLFASSVGEPVELLRATVEQGFRDPITSRYESVFVSGNPYVVEHLAAMYDTDQQSILPTTGATGGLSLLYRAYLSPGDHVLVESPGFDLFTDIAHTLGARVDHFRRTGDRFEVDPEEVRTRIRSDTRLIVLTNLHNPSGMLLDDEVLTELARLAEERGIIVVIDEVYGDYAEEQLRPRRAAQVSPNLVSVSSLTKIYGLSTLRCGWVVAHPEALRPVRALNDQFEFGVSKLAHAVAALVMDDRASFDAYWRGIINSARPVMERYFSKWVDEGHVAGLLPEYGCIAFPRLTGIPDTQRFCSWLADRHGVIAVPGELFGAAGHVRLGFAQTPADLDCALGRFTLGLQEYHESIMTKKDAEQS